MAADSKAVFLSYASQDADAARRIAEALRGFGVEVWFDQNELRGGDAWDHKIRRQIRECAMFLPVISEHTQERGEGYFRLEWKLAAERTHLMAEGMPFIMPVAIGDTPENGAAVPAEFMKVQWTRLGDGLPTTPFVEQVRRLLESPRKPAGTQKPTPAHAPAPVAPKSGFPLAYVALGIVVVALIAFIALRPAAVGPVSDRPSVVPTSVAPVADAKSVAVLPFVNLSGDKEQDYFSDGLTEEILNALARERDLRVPGSASSFSFKGKNTPPAEIARALNVTRLIEGSVRKAGTRVRISVKLTRAADGFSEELGTFTEEVSDIFALQDKVARTVVEKITGRAATNTVAVSTKNPAAYDAYLRGRAAQMRGWSERSSAETIRYYEEALRLDPDYALAWARLAETCVRIFSTGYDRSNEVAAKARAAVASALRLDPNLPEAHLAQARINHAIDRDVTAARRELDAVERLRPGEVEVPAVRALVAYSAGQWGDPLAALVARAVEADPQNADTLVEMAPLLTGIGRFAEAERLCDRAAAAGEPGEETIRLKHLNLHTWTGDSAAALALLETMPAAAREKNNRFFNSRAYYRNRRGDAAGAIADYEHTRVIVAEHYPNRTGPRGVAVSALYRIARIEVQLGHAARATQLDDQALAEMEKFVRDFPGNNVTSYTRALILAHRGQSVEALALMEEAARIVASTRDVAAILFQRLRKTGVLAALGRLDEAVAELRAVHEAGYAFGYGLRTSEDYTPLRGDARFQQLMAEAEARANAQPRPKK